MPKTDEVLLARAKAMRTRATPAEQKLWHVIRGHRFNRVKFTRQVVIGPFIADFVARMRKLVIEIDGDTHGHQLGYDAARTAKIEALGYRVIRFTNADVMGNIEGVAQVIEAELNSSTAPLPSQFRGPDGSIVPPARSSECRGHSEPDRDAELPGGERGQ